MYFAFRLVTPNYRVFVYPKYQEIEYFKIILSPIQFQNTQYSSIYLDIKKIVMFVKYTLNVSQVSCKPHALFERLHWGGHGGALQDFSEPIELGRKARLLTGTHILKSMTFKTSVLFYWLWPRGPLSSWTSVNHVDILSYSIYLFFMCSV